MKSLDLKLRGGREKSRWKADINNIISSFNLPYILPNPKNKMLTLIDKNQEKKDSSDTNDFQSSEPEQQSDTEA